MQHFALMDGAVVVEVVRLEAGVSIAERFHPEVVAAARSLSAAEAKTVRERWTWTGERFEAPKDPEEPAKTRIYKADIWRRCTDAEAETLKQLLAQATARQQGLWQDAQYLDMTDPDFAFVTEAAQSAFPDERVAALLQPTF